MLKRDFIALFNADFNSEETTIKQWDEVLRLLITYNLLSTFWQFNGKRIKSHVPQQFLRHAESAVVFSEAQRKQTFIAANLVTSTLKKQGIKCIFLKGAAYSLANTNNSRGRLFSDIDILIAHSELTAAEKALKSSGWQVKELDDHDNKYYREWSHELPPMTNFELGVSLDVHHTLLPPISGYEIDIPSLFGSSIEVDANIYVPSKAYMILHSTVHLLLNEDVEKGFRDLIDIKLLFEELCTEVNSDTDSALSILEATFAKSGLQSEFRLIVLLLNEVFALNLGDMHATSKEKRWCVLYSNAIFQPSAYLDGSEQSFASLAVYLRGHFLKMPPSIFIKHITYKLYRTVTKKLLGNSIFRS